MITALLIAAGCAVVGLVIALYGRSQRARGRSEAQVKHIDKVLENADKARRARADPDNSRVRKFDRPE